jgi:hypothetical protein
MFLPHWLRAILSLGSGEAAALRLAGAVLPEKVLRRGH